MRRFGAMALLALALAAACTASEVDPDARIDIGGTIRRQNGDGAKEVRVALTREADVGEVFTVFATLGLACVDAHTDVCLGSRVTKTGASGTFNYTIKGRDTQGFAGQASTMVLTSQLGPRPTEASGPISTYRFQVQTERLALPVAFWEPRLNGSTGAFGAKVTWDAVPGRILPPGLGGASPEYAVEFRRGDETVWTLDDARSGFAFDARLLEDAAGTGSVVADLFGERVADEHGRAIDLVLRSGSRYFQGHLVPVSRGAGCWVPDPGGRPVAQSPCPLTDGSFKEESGPSACPGKTNCAEAPGKTATIDLRTVQPLTLVVVRGCSLRCTVETSKNQRTWRTAGVTTDEYAAVRLEQAVAARFVRVTSDVSIAEIRDVSAWTGSGAAAAGPLFIDPVPGLPVPPGFTATPGPRAIPIDEKDESGWIVVLAAAVLGAVGGAVIGITLSRRRRRAV